MSGDAGLLIKICGVTTPEDAALAVAAGADAIGVNLWPGSKRYVDPAAARAVLARHPRRRAQGRRVRRRARRRGGAPRSSELGLDRAQLHGDEARGGLRGARPARLIRVVRVRDEASFDAEAGWRPALWLYDAFVDGFGGGGVPAPWPLIARARRGGRSCSRAA